ncbi:helix-turn-helix domain-containing protein [Streptomyces sp. H27-S2]|uniref:helix-turn-helix domain-containing protein n=1 Tax=Streptomyces antarcticus TaxID=2996458 RepID=UPI0022704D6F|nr:helix-turn-helix domain-containing protein [Streptomyces sp. H27-S2]MCY0947998.1 helix-turn-helix domain-containing protein [Streptomyces sp. H27-S2]
MSIRLRTDVLNAKAEEAGDHTSLAIATRAGVRNSTITRLLAGETTPSVATLVRLRDAYGIDTLDELLALTSEVCEAEEVSA